jgi:hypothetical protein
MLDIKNFDSNQIEFIKSKFLFFINELVLKLNESRLFKLDDRCDFPYYNSLSHLVDENCGLMVRWENNFSSFKIIVKTKKKIQSSTKNLFGIERLLEKYEYGFYHFNPFNLKERYHENDESETRLDIFKENINNGLFNINNKEEEFLKEIVTQFSNFLTEIITESNINQHKLSEKKDNLISDLDNDSNGEVDLVDGESFNKLLTKNQKSIIEIDKNYIQKFVKISMYLKTKKSNTQKIFDSIKDTKNDKELNELVNLLKNQIHTYELLVFHSINMITSLVESDLITFYEIYECFDQLGVFNSNWENEVSDKLTDIGDGIKDLMYSIYQMENKIVNSIDNLTYVTQDSFKDLSMSVNNQLSSIDSSIKFNNLLTGIQTYQMYKINQNTKRIN